MPTLRSFFLILCATAAFTSCGREGGAPPPEERSSAAMLASPSAVPADASAGFAATPLAEVVNAKGADPISTAQVRDSSAPNMIIRNGSVSIEVDSLELAMGAVRSLAATLGGFVGNVVINTGEYTVRSATLELKIPSSRFDDAMTRLTPIGKVENSSSTAEDVGEEFVDLTARMSNSRRLEERLVSLLATRTGKLEDVLAVERELARVRESIERTEGRMRYLRSRVAMSTLSITVHEKAPLVSAPGSNVIGEAFKDMWRNFVGFIAAVISSLGVVIPVAAVVAAIVWWWKRRRKAAP